MKKTNQRNLLIVMADQLSALALGCYGHGEVISPHINHIAAPGVVYADPATLSYKNLRESLRVPR